MDPIRTFTMVVAACLAVAGAARGQTVEMDRTVDVQPGTRLQLDNTFGGVTIRTWDRNSVRVQGRHPVGTTVEIQPGGALLQIEADHPGDPGKPIVYTLTIPADMAIEVITMGRARLCPASISASVRDMPARTISMAKSTSRIEFLVTRPISMSSPMNANSESGWFAMMRPRNAPPSESGNAVMIVIGWKKSRNSNTSTM